MIKEEGLRDWFGKSKSKDGKSGWVNVVTGGTCASDEPGEGTPKCVSSSKRASMSKKERLSAQRRKKAADPGQQSKSGAAKPTYVPTDKPKKKMKEETVIEATDKKGKGSGSKDACYHKVKSRYSVWPSAYASGALVKCRKAGAANWGNKSEGMEEFYNLPELTEAQIGALKYAGVEVEVVDEACWKGYEKKGMKTMFGKKYPNCVKKEEVELTEEVVIDIAFDGLIEEGYEEDDVRQAISWALYEAKVTFGHDTKKPEGLMAKAKKRLSMLGKKARHTVAKGQVAAYNKKREISQNLGDRTRKARQAVGNTVKKVKEAPGKAKSGAKNFVKKQAQKVVDRMSEDVQNVEELYKGKHGQTEKEYQDSRSDAGKMISGDSKVSGSAYSSRATSSTGPNPAGGSKKPMGQGRMGAKDREYLKYRKGMMKKEEYDTTEWRDGYAPTEIETTDLIKPEPMKGQLHELERVKYQVGNMYQVIFGWRGKMMMVKLFFPDAKIPNRQKVAASLDKMYPGAQLRSYSHSVVDYDDPYINVGVDEETHIHEEKEEEKYCRLCEKKEPRSKCSYGGKMWDKYSVDNVDDEKGESDSGITSESLDSGDYNKDVERRMQTDENRKRSNIRNKQRLARYRQNKNLPANKSARRADESYSNWRQSIQEDMSGMSQKSGDKRSTESGAGMTAKGVAKYNRRTGGNLKTAVTTPPSKLKPGSKAANRRKSFCARSRGWTGERGKAARRRWNC